jgi:hypothetical protein
VPPSPQSPNIPTPMPPPSIQQDKEETSKMPALPLRDDAQLVDFISSFLFPIAFIIFNIIYWMVYLNMQVFSGN